MKQGLVICSLEGLVTCCFEGLVTCCSFFFLNAERDRLALLAGAVCLKLSRTAFFDLLKVATPLDLAPLSPSSVSSASDLTLPPNSHTFTGTRTEGEVELHTPRNKDVG